MILGTTGSGGGCVCVALPVDDFGAAYHAHSTEIAEEAQRRGLEVMLHLPMRAIANETPEAHQLEAGMSGEEVARVLNGMLESVLQPTG